MFAQSQPVIDRRWTYSRLVSLAVHGIFLGVLLYEPRPIFVTPSSVVLGTGHDSGGVVYLVAAASPSSANPKSAITIPSAAPKVRPKPRKTEAAAVKPEETPATNAMTETARAGSPYGSLANGLTTGHEVRPALPISFADPRVSASELPGGMQGDVVVEITIDAGGNIVETKVLKRLGYGLEEKVLAALQNWRFRPATRDGVAIPSQQYVYFHFPS
jgi:periplasmic protein TonB